MFGPLGRASYNLATDADVTINGVDPGDWSGRSVATGDVNGDGAEDLIIGAVFGDPGGRTNAGETYVVFGPLVPGTLELSTDSDITVNGIDDGDTSGAGVGTGDINGDGAQDLIIGANNAETESTESAGETYVIFGPLGAGTLELSAEADITLNGEDRSRSGSVASGDLNGDGRQDLIIGAPEAAPSGRADAGETYVVFGPVGPGTWALSTKADVTVNGIDPTDWSGGGVAAGDVNGDGAQDLIIGATGADPWGKERAGEIYVTFGPLGPGTSELFADANITLNGIGKFYGTGSGVASGDVNGDGEADLIIGALFVGQTYVILGPLAITSPPALSIADVPVDEGVGNAILTISLDAASAGDVTVTYAASDGTATAPADYTATTGTATIAAGATSVTIDIPIVDDALDENDETFTVTLSNPTGGAVIIVGVAVVIIVDNDASPPTLFIEGATVTEGEPGATLAISLDRAATGDVTVSYATSDGTATAPADYTATAGTATIAAGATSVTIEVPILDDDIDEPDDMFTVTLSNASGGATISPTAGSATVTIVDDDPSPQLRVMDLSVSEDAGVATVTVNLQGASSGGVSVDFATADGTATVAGGDYVASSGTLSWPAGVGGDMTFSVPVNDDQRYEDDETVVLELSNAVSGGPEGVVVADGTALLTVVDNDTRVYDPALQAQLNAGGIVVTWASAQDEDGHVEWAMSAAELATSPNVASDVRGALLGRLNKRTHRVEIAGVPGGSTIHYIPVMGGVPDPNGPYVVTLPSVPLSAAPVGITGRVSYPDGSPGRECLVYIRVEHLFLGLVLRSLPISGLTDGGEYAADIKNIRLEGAFDQPLFFGADSQDSTIILTAMCDSEMVGTITSTTAEADKLVVGATVSEYQNMDVAIPKRAPVPLLTGLNLVGLPLGLTTAFSASDLAAQIGAQGGEVAQVVRWDAASQSYVLWSAASPAANDFLLNEGGGYFVLVVAPPAGGAWTFRGTPFTQRVPTTFVVGLNMVSFPFMSQERSHDAVSLAGALRVQGTQVAQIIRWDPASQRFALWSAAAPAANVFAISETEGYFVLATQ